MNDLGVIVGPTRYGDPKTGAVRFFLDLVDLDADDKLTRRIPLAFFAHGFALHPTRRNEAALLEKRGPGGAYVDLTARRVLRAIEPEPGHAFYGHGAFSAGGDVLFAVETDLSTMDGAISVKDASTFQALGRVPTFGKAPHDCHLVEEGRTLAITNGGGRAGTPDFASVTFVDVATRTLLERHEVSNPDINTGHVAVLEGRAFAVVSAPRDGLPELTSLGGVSVRRRGEGVVQLTEPTSLTRRFVGESLSVCIHEPTRRVFATHPYGSVATLWDLDTGALVASLDVPSPRGVTTTLDGRYFALACGLEASLVLLDTDMRRVEGRYLGAGRFGGSHVYAWSRPRVP